MPVHRLSAHSRCGAVAGSGAGRRFSRPSVAARAAAGIFRLSRLETRDSRGPGRLAECLSILAADPDARLIAGGTDLGVESNLRGGAGAHLVSLEGIAELREFSETAEHVLHRRGASAERDRPALGDSRVNGARGVSENGWRCSPPRLSANRATLGGNLATASPIGDGAPLLLALDASVHMVSHRGRRRVPSGIVLHGIPADGARARRTDRRDRNSQASARVREVL